MTDDQERVAVEWVPIFGGRSRRRRFICRCGRGAWSLYARGGACLCRQCAGVPHRRRSAIARAAALRRSIGLDQFEPLPLVAPPWSRLRWYLTIAEIARLEEEAYDNDAALGELEFMAEVLGVR